MTGKARCLLITLVVPASSGHGGAIRAGLTLEALSRHFAVTLLIATRNSPDVRATLPPEMEALCEAVHVVHAPRAPGGDTAPWFEPRMMRWNLANVAQQLPSLREAHFDTVHVVRLGLVPVWRRLKSELGVSARRVVLDLDDIESRTHFRLVRELGLECGRLGIFRELGEGFKLRHAENRAAAEVDRMLVCSEEDRQVLARRIAPTKLAVAPNSARFPALPPRRARDGRTRLLFVGSLFYGPNQHALRWLLAEIIPTINRRRAGEPVELAIVGRRPPDWLEGLARSCGAIVHADVPSVTPFYEATDVVLTPIRSGGGTRIKIIEAFGHGRPVISTRIGAEGLAVRDGEELLLAETADEFATTLERLDGDDELYEHIVRNARSLVDERYSPQSFAASMLAAHAPRTGRPDS